MNSIKRTISFNIIYFLVFLVFLIISCTHIFNTWKEHKDIVKSQAFEIGGAVGTFLKTDHIKKLDLSSDDIRKPEYNEIKESLVIFRNSSKNIDNAFLYILTDKKIYLIDSEGQDADKLLFSGPYFEKNSDKYSEPLSLKKGVIIGPLKTAQKSWMRILTPVTDPETGKAIAVLGYDLPALLWNKGITKHVMADIIAAAIMFILLLSLYFVIFTNLTLRRRNKNQQFNENVLTMLLKHAPVGIAIVRDFNFITGINKEIEKILGRTKEELRSLDWKDITHPDDLEKDLKLFKEFKAGKIQNYRLEKRFIKPDGSSIWVDMIVTKLEQAGKNHLCIMEDISKKVKTLETLRESERSKSLLLSHLPGIAYRCSFDKDWTMQFISEGSLKLTGYSAEDLIDNKIKSFNEIIAPEYTRLVWKKIENSILLKEHFHLEYEIITASGERKWVWEIGQGIPNSRGEVETLEGIIIDIDETKKQQLKIKFMNKHDTLTGLYHRKYYEDAKERLDKEKNLPITIIILDINGLRFVNDTLGYHEGDYIIRETGKILKSCLRSTDLIARIGGDEFAAILTKTDRIKASFLLHKIEDQINEYNKSLKEKTRYISAAIGYGTKTSAIENLKDIVKEAEEYVNKRKLLEIKSYHHTILTSIMDSSYARSYETEQHAKRLAHISKLIGKKMNLPLESLDELELFSMLHDIGKVAVDDKILNKPGKLNSEEWEIVKKHSETGYRIAAASPELESVSRYILYHHERWDGTGYPHGLKGEEIPLPARILAFADAYDVMTAGRSYKKAMTKREAVAEIKKNVGKQFDPAIFKAFMEVLKEV